MASTSDATQVTATFMSAPPPLSNATSSASTPSVNPDFLLQVIQALHSSGFGKANLNSWIIDSGVTNHMTGSLNILKYPTSYGKGSNIFTANGQSLSIDKIKSLSIPIPNAPPLSLTNVLYVPSLSSNLISVAH